ncbi:HAD family hydrolase [Alicyclobacillus herbarius]|uniref:HAD family hydrolase n=1 Tax=Alicyclobacillus herbarius TaxID=122960 RepID=UPI0004108643|nr:HAD family hydrolase [Alicyclobacillus herbarius]
MALSVTKRPAALLFDLDGTLFQTETLSVPAYERTFADLRKEGLWQGPTPPVERFLGSLGLLLDEIWQNVMPEADSATRRRADVLLLQHQLNGLKQGEGQLYPGVAETLQGLVDLGCQLFVASNGLEAYVKDVLAATGIAPWFTGIYSAGEYKTASKVELVRLLLEHHDITSAWMVGDRQSDVEAGKQNDLFVVGCDYGGFHKPAELTEADVIIHTFADLLPLVRDAE